MAEKRKKGTEPEKTTAEYYKINTQAVEDLVTADESNSPEVSQKELNKYKSGLKITIPNWVKAVFIKFWFPAAVCYFFIWGLSSHVYSLLDLLFITAVAMGVVTDLLTNNLLRFIANTNGEYDRFMMFTQNKFYTFFANILYAFLVTFMVFVCYNIANMILMPIFGYEDEVVLGVGPVSFGIFYMACDMFCIEIKHLFSRIVRDAKIRALQGE